MGCASCGQKYAARNGTGRADRRRTAEGETLSVSAPRPTVTVTRRTTHRGVTKNREIEVPIEEATKEELPNLEEEKKNDTI